MNYLVAVDRLHLDAPGGGYIIAWELAQLMRDQGHDAAILCATVGPDSPPEGVTEHEGIRIVRYRSCRTWWRIYRRDKDHIAAAAEAAAKYLGDRTWDVIHAHMPLPGLGALASCGKVARTVYTIHSPMVLETKINWAAAGLRGRLKLALGMRRLRSLEASAMANFKVLHCLSQFTRREMDRLYGVGDRIEPIPYWSPREGVATITTDEARKRLGWESSGPLLFCLRRMTPRMGLETALEALAPLANDHEFKLVMAGDGPLRGALERQAMELGLGDKVEFTGRLSEEQVCLAYQAADLFLLPTRALECFGLIVLEAFQFGCPVLASDAGAIPELIERVSSEWLFPAGDSGAMRDRLRAFFTGELQPPPGAALRNIVEHYYSRQVLFPRWYTRITGETLPQDQPLRNGGN